jgi:hypothetical protein
MNSRNDVWLSHSWALLLFVSALSVSFYARADTPAQTCDRLANDSVSLDSIDGAAALDACSAAAAAAPGDSKLQYEYGRDLERAGKGDQAKQLYQWIAADGFAPAIAALGRMEGPLSGKAAARQQLAQNFEALADITDRLVKSLPSDHEDPNVILSQTGLDPVKILAWVKANVRLIPYAGMLRGAPGVLMDRMGNSLDRALFLADLLHRAGYNVRIAQTRMGSQLAQRLRQRFIATAGKPAPLAPSDTAAVAGIVGNDPRIDSKQILQAYEKQIAGAQISRASAAKVYNKLVTQVTQLVGDDPARDVRLASEAEGLLMDYFWVERQKDATWEALDPDSDLLGPLSAIQNFPADNIPQNLKQRIVVTLRLETLSGGELSEMPLLEQTWLPADVCSLSITLTHQLSPQQPLSSVLNYPDPEAQYVSQLDSANVVMPVLHLGTKTVNGKLYTFTGEIADPTPENLAALGGDAIIDSKKLAGGIAAAFGDALSTPNVRVNRVVTAEWLDIAISIPGQQTRTERRAIFDLLGAASRAARPLPNFSVSQAASKYRLLSLNAIADMYVFGATPTPTSVERRSGKILSPAFRRLAAEARTPTSTGHWDSSAPRLEIPLWEWAAARGAGLSDLKISLTEPNVAMWWETPVENPNSREIREQYRFDIVNNAATDDTTYLTRVSQGIMDTVLENPLFVPGTSNQNAALFMAKDLDQGRRWQLFKANVGSSLGANASSDVRAALARDSASGKFIVGPPDALDISNSGWFTVDTKDGQTKGVDTAGRGDSMVEWTYLVTNVMTYTGCLMVIQGERKTITANGNNFGGMICTLGLFIGAPAAAFGAASAGALTGLAAAIETVGTAYALESGKL